jgi:hypothetical protein
MTSGACDDGMALGLGLGNEREDDDADGDGDGDANAPRIILSGSRRGEKVAKTRSISRHCHVRITIQ